MGKTAPRMKRQQISHEKKSKWESVARVLNDCRLLNGHRQQAKNMTKLRGIT